jgi:hypothetical protein
VTPAGGARAVPAGGGSSLPLPGGPGVGFDRRSPGWRLIDFHDGLQSFAWIVIVGMLPRFPLSATYVPIR